MIMVILSILKFIGLAILAVLLLLLLLLLIVLVVPLRYKVSGEAGNDGIHMKCNFSYLFHIISVNVIFEKKLEFLVKIFGISLKLNNNKKNSKSNKKKKETIEEPEDRIGSHIESNAVSDQSLNSNVGAVSENSDSVSIESGNEQGIDAVAVHEHNDDNVNTNEADDEEVNKKPKEKHEEQSEEQSAEQLAEQNEEQSLLEKISFYCDLITSDETRAAFGTVKFRIGKILRTILPKKGRVYIAFGSGDAGLVGKILGYYQALYVYIGHVVTFVPNFIEKKFEADIYIKGRIIPVLCIYQLIRIYMDKNCRRIIKLFIKKK